METAKRSEVNHACTLLDGSQCLLLYFELAVYVALMNGHYMLIETKNSPKYNYMIGHIMLVQKAATSQATKSY